MKRSNKIFLTSLVVMLTLSFFVNFYITKEFTDVKLDYYNTTDLLPKTSANPYSAYDYDFNDDTIGTEPIGWNTVLAGIEVISSLGNQIQPVRMVTTNNELFNNFSVGQISGFVELKIRVENEPRVWVELRNGTTGIIRLYFYNTGDLSIYYNGGLDSVPYSFNQWYYVKITFDCDTDLFGLEIRENDKNGLLIYNEIDFPFSVNTNEINKLWFQLKNTADGIIDDIDYSWTTEFGDDQEIPIIWNLIEITDPLEYGNNFTIYIDIYDLNNISYLYFEYENINHTMINITDTKYYYSNWVPIYFGINYYTIWFSDDLFNYGSIEGSFIVQRYSDVLIQENLYTVMSISILIFLMFLMIIVYLKFRIFLIILGISLFSIIIGAYSIVNYTIPFTPIFQSFFILFQMSFLLITTNQVYSKKR